MLENILERKTQCKIHHKEGRTFAGQGIVSNYIKTDCRRKLVNVEGNLNREIFISLLRLIFCQATKINIYFLHGGGP